MRKTGVKKTFPGNTVFDRVAGYADNLPAMTDALIKTGKRDKNGRTDQRAFERVQPGLQNGY